MNEALITDIGTTRETNQDTLAIETNLAGDKIYILCDGMGGYKGGEIASLECSRFMAEDFKKSEFSDVDSIKEWLFNTIKNANKKINEISKKNSELEKMGTTIVCLVVTKSYKVYASVGDSRIYSYNHKEMIQLSEDQTFANALLKAGYINEKEAEIHPKKSLLLSAIGSSEEELDIQINEIIDNNNYLLCSDGLYNMVENKEIHKIINSNLDIEKRAQSLIDKANSNGGKDNISVILVEGSL